MRHISVYPLHGCVPSGSSPFLCVIWVLASRCGFVGVSCRSGGAEHGLFAGDVPEPGDGVGLHEFAVGLLGEDRLAGLREAVLLDEHGPAMHTAASVFGNTPMTRARRLISRLRRSRWLLVRMYGRSPAGSCITPVADSNPSSRQVAA